MPGASADTRSSPNETPHPQAPEPYRGLRYFDESDAHLFFGRDEQVDDVLERLRRSSFVAVLGTSGSGKSSLVRAGLIPALRAGLLVGAGGRWRVVITQPANAPIKTLAERLASSYGQQSPADIEVTLRRGPLGLRQLFEQVEVDVTQANTLLVVDQFEELFRFQREASRAQASCAAEEAAAYVKLLLTVTNADCPVYVVLTMRSDFLGNCAQFRDLPERINEGVYLVPRMARDQLRAAVVGPVAVVGGEIEAALVQRVLNDVGDDPDQLATLQHAMLMTWRQNPGSVRLADYIRAGTLNDALSRDANRVFDGLSHTQQRMAQVLFQRLSERDADRREVRRRCTVDEAALVAGTSPAAMSTVVEAFRGSGLLLRIGNLVDVIHESLLRKWDRLQGTDGVKGWLDEEAEARDIFLELDRRERRRSGPSDLLRGADLLRARQWARRRRQAAWASRYIPEQGRLARIRSYIAQSTQALRTETREHRAHIARRFRVTLAVASASMLIAIAFGILSFYLWQMSNDIEDTAIVAAAKEVVDRDPTKALLLLDEVTSPTAISTMGGLQTALRIAGAVHSAVTFRHAEPVKLAAFSPDGSRVATVTATGEVSLWAADAPAERWTVAERVGPVSRMEFSADGSRLVAGSANGTASVWRVDRSAAPLRLEGHRGPITSVSFEPSSRARVLTSSTDGTVRLWNSENGFVELPLPSAEIPKLGSADTLQNLAEAVLQKSFSVPPPVRIARFSPDGRLVAAGRNDGSVIVWLPDSTGSPRAIDAHAASVRVVAFSPDSTRLLTAADDGLVKLWSLEGEPRLLGDYSHPQAVTIGTFDPSGVRILTASGDGSVRVSYTNGKPPLHLTAPNPAIVAHWSPDGQRVVGISLDRTIWVWNLNEQQRHVPSRQQETSRIESNSDGRPVVTPQLALRGHDGAVWSAVFDSRGERVLSASDDKTARIWDLDAGSRNIFGADDVDPEAGRQLVNAVFGPRQSIVTVASDGRAQAWFADSRQPVDSIVPPIQPTVSTAAPSGTMVGLGFMDGRVQVIWPTDAAKPPIELEGSSAGAQAIAFSSDDKIVAAGFTDGSAIIWRLDTPNRSVGLTGHEGKVSVMAFSPDGQRLATASDDATVVIWRVDGTRLRSFGPLPGPVGTLAFSPDGRMLLSGAGDGKARIWTVDNDTDPLVLTHGSQITNVAFTSDGRRILTLSNEEMKVWSGRGWQNQVTIGSAGSTIMQASFAPLGRDLVVSASDDGVARVWHQDGKGDPLELRGHSKAVVMARFNADGSRVLTASKDGTARLWTVDFRELVSSVRQRLKTCLSADDRIRFLGESATSAKSAFDTCEARRKTPR